MHFPQNTIFRVFAREKLFLTYIRLLTPHKFEKYLTKHTFYQETLMSKVYIILTDIGILTALILEV